MKSNFSRKKNFSEKSHRFYIFTNPFHVCLHGGQPNSQTSVCGDMLFQLKYRRKPNLTEMKLKRKEYFNNN